MIGLVFAPVLEELRRIRDGWTRLVLRWLEATGLDKPVGRFVEWLGRKLR